LRAGGLRLLDAPADVLAWERFRGEDRRACAVNFVGEPREITLPGRLRVEAGTHGREPGADFDGRLSPDEAVVLRPESA
ncbi:MAG: alpha-amylase, partial [Alphaproteobacteria bacterium]